MKATISSDFKEPIDVEVIVTFDEHIGNNCEDGLLKLTMKSNSSIHELTKLVKEHFNLKFFSSNQDNIMDHIVVYEKKNKLLGIKLNELRKDATL